MRIRELVYLLFITAFSIAGVQAGEFKSRYLKTTKEDLKEFYSKKYQKTEEKAEAEKPSVKTTFPRWSDFGKVVGKVDDYVIIKTKDGNYLVKRDWRK